MTKLISRDKEALLFAIQKSCEIKRSIVMQDEKENNVRALLNLGHTFAHAIEKRWASAHGYMVKQSPMDYVSPLLYPAQWAC